MRLPLVSRKRFEAVKAERDDMARRLRQREAGTVTVNVRADTSEFEDAMERQPHRQRGVAVRLPRLPRLPVSRRRHEAEVERRRRREHEEWRELHRVQVRFWRDRVVELRHERDAAREEAYWRRDERDEARRQRGNAQASHRLVLRHLEEAGKRVDALRARVAELEQERDDLVDRIRALHDARQRGSQIIGSDDPSLGPDAARWTPEDDA